VPLPDPVGLLRGLALTFMDIRDLTINYNGERTSRSTNVGTAVRDSTGAITDVTTSYSLLDAVQGNGPSLGYRLGLDRSIDPQTERVFPQGQNVRDAFSNRHRFEARTALSPSSSFNIDLNWNVSWSARPQTEFRKSFPTSGPPTPGDTTTIRRIERESGSGSASVWAFGSYQSFFELQLERLQRNAESSGRVWTERKVALTEPSVAGDFRTAYLTGGTSIAGNGFVPLPLPGWNMRYSGLSDWPLIQRVAENVSLSHGYNATYETGFSSNSTAGDTTSVTVAGQTVQHVESEFSPNPPQIQEQFQPLIGIDITWPWDLQTSFRWNRSVTTALRGVDAVRERKTGELSGSMSYSRRGLRLPFLPRIENRIRLSANVSYSITNERTYNLTSALNQAANANFDYDPAEALTGDNVEPQRTSRLTVSPEISYTVSNRVTANFRLNYEKFSGNNTGQSSYTNVDGTFNLTVSISEN
jgi:cell surface protein SprA